MKSSKITLAIVLLCGILYTSGLYWQAATAPISPHDELLWFDRAHTFPWDLRTAHERAIAIDVPSLNRLVYWAGLRLTNNLAYTSDMQTWKFENGVVSWPYNAVLASPVKLDNSLTREKWIEYYGAGVPYKALMVMREINMIMLLILLVSLYYTANLILKSPLLAMAATLPVALCPVYVTSLGIWSWSGDIFVVALFGVGLALWVKWHMSNAFLTGTRKQRWLRLIAIAAIGGLATSSKQTGVLFVLAFAVYLCISYSGHRRIWVPVLVSLVSFFVFCLLNPCIWFYTSVDVWPWQILGHFISRRRTVIAQYISSRGPMSTTDILQQTFWWFPVMPIVCVAVWRCRHERWLLPILIWGAFIVFGTAIGILQTHMLYLRYVAPIELGAFFPIAIVLLSSFNKKEECKSKWL